MKWNEHVNSLAGDLVTFVDDMRVMGYSIENCWQCGRKLSATLQFLGIQEAARKRTSPTLNANAWAGCVAKTDGLVSKSIAQAKWDKAKLLIAELRSCIGTEDHPGLIPHKFLEKKRGYFNHVGITYDILVPHLRGYHNALDSWREKRTAEGWKDKNRS